MYGKFSVGYRVISERATMELQYRDASLHGVYVPMPACTCQIHPNNSVFTNPVSVNTLPGTTQMVTPLAKSTPITQSSQMPAISDTLPPVRDILEPTSNEQVRSAYLKRLLH